MADKYNLGVVRQGIIKTELWSGNASSQGVIQLNDSVKNYKFIYLYINSYSTTNSRQCVSYIIDTDDIDISYTGHEFMFAITTSNTDSRVMSINFSNGLDKITINMVKNNATSNITLRKVVGIN